jgi:hypothetical protein
MKNRSANSPNKGKKNCSINLVNKCNEKHFEFELHFVTCSDSLLTVALKNTQVFLYMTKTMEVPQKIFLVHYNTSWFSWYLVLINLCIEKNFSTPDKKRIIS